jgi:hypothetical protein
VPHRDQVFAELRARGICVGVHYPPNHLQPAFAAWRRPLPVTEQVGQEILTLPLHQHLTHNDIARVAAALHEALETTGAASRTSPWSHNARHLQEAGAAVALEGAVRALLFDTLAALMPGARTVLRRIADVLLQQVQDKAATQVPILPLLQGSTAIVTFLGIGVPEWPAKWDWMAS